jgi:hypothetical protein
MSILTDPSVSQEVKLDQSIGTPGSAKPSQALQIGGTDGTNLQPIATDTTGAVKLAAGTNTIGNVNIASALPAGANKIGSIDVASLPSLPAGTNTIGGVNVASALPAGTNIIGKVGIDQTTDGTTNRVVAKISQTSGENVVVVGSALPAGTNNIGKVDVNSLPSLPAGSNTIGAVTEASLDATIGTPGSAAPSKAQAIGGSDGTNLRTITTDTTGHVIIANERTSGPSTTTALGASGTYTSSSVSTQGFSRITGSVFADQPGTLNVQQSPDGTNWDVVSSFSVSANAGTGFSVELVCSYVRLNYVNGATAQTVFRLYSFLRRFA